MNRLAITLCLLIVTGIWTNQAIAHSPAQAMTEAAQRLIETVSARIPLDRIAGHYHDTCGMAIANIYASLQCGVTTFDASIAGLGGCPYAQGASGNVATEDVVYLLNGLGIETGVDLDALIECAWWINAALGRPPVSKVARARASQRCAEPPRSLKEEKEEER